MTQIINANINRTGSQTPGAPLLLLVSAGLEPMAATSEPGPAAPNPFSGLSSSHLDNSAVKFLQLMNEMASTGHQTATKKRKGNTEDFRRLQKNTKVNLPLLKAILLPQVGKLVCM